VGTAIEQDGQMTFDWEPGDELWNSGYLYVEIDDGRNPPVRAYYKENIRLVRSHLLSPVFRSREVVDDALILNLKLDSPEQIDSLKVYYTRDLETEVLSSYATAPVGNQIKLKDGPIKPGRIYQLGVAAVDIQGAETHMSDLKKIKYQARNENNYPFFRSEPVLEAEAEKEYVYALAAVDWDNDPLTFVLESAPEGMVLDDGNRTLRWTPSDEDAGDNFVVLVVGDGRGGTDIQEYTLKVATQGTAIATVETNFIDSESGPVFEVQVSDHLADIDSNVQDELTVKIADVYGYEEWELVLSETSANSGVFKRSIDLRSSFESIPHWLLDNPLRNLEHELVVNWEPREGKTRKIKTVLN